MHDRIGIAIPPTSARRARDAFHDFSSYRARHERSKSVKLTPLLISEMPHQQYGAAQPHADATERASPWPATPAERNA